MVSALWVRTIIVFLVFLNDVTVSYLLVLIVSSPFRAVRMRMVCAMVKYGLTLKGLPGRDTRLVPGGTDGGGAPFQGPVPAMTF